MKIRLENIGPLSTAEVDLSVPAIFYGENGSGKTTVIKALKTMLDLVHKGSARVSPLLIKAGEKQGSIMLMTDGHEYALQLEIKGRNMAIRVSADGQIKLDIEAPLAQFKVQGEVKPQPLQEIISNYALLWVRNGELNLVTNREEVPSLRFRDFINIAVLQELLSKVFNVNLSDEDISYIFSEYFDNLNEIFRLTLYDVAPGPQGTCINTTVYKDETEIPLYICDEYYVAYGIRSVLAMSAALSLAHVLNKFKDALNLGRVLVFIESFECSLHVDYAHMLIDRIKDFSDIPVIVETHIALALKAGLEREFNVYVFENGIVKHIRNMDELRGSELYNKEADIYLMHVGESA